MKSVFKLKFFVSLVLLASFFILVLNGCKKSEVEPDFVAKEILITDFDCPAIAITAPGYYCSGQMEAYELGSTRS